MIKRVDKKNLPEFLKLCDNKNFFATYLYTYGSIYYNVPSSMELWLGYDCNSQAVFASASTGGGYVIYAKDYKSYEYVWAYLSFFPNEKVICSKDLMDYLSRKMFIRHNHSYIMEYTSKKRQRPRNLPLHPHRYKDMYQLLSSIFPKICLEKNSDQWVYTTSLKERRGFAYPLCFYGNENKAIACGMIEALNTNTVIIGSIAVDKAYQHHGYGGNIVKSLVSISIDKEKSILLNCKNKNLISFYADLGFEVVDNYCYSI